MPPHPIPHHTPFLTTAIWKELDSHLNQDGDEEISRGEYMGAVKEAILKQVGSSGSGSSGSGSSGSGQ
jgi:hypothetical protein